MLVGLIIKRHTITKNKITLHKMIIEVMLKEDRIKEVGVITIINKINKKRVGVIITRISTIKMIVITIDKMIKNNNRINKIVGTKIMILIVIKIKV